MFYGRDYGEKVPLSNRTEALIRPEIEQGGQRSYPAQVAQRRSHIETRVRPHHGHDRHLCEHERERGSGTRCVRYCTSSIFSDIFHRCISPGLKLGKYSEKSAAGRTIGNDGSWGTSPLTVENSSTLRVTRQMRRVPRGVFVVARQSPLAEPEPSESVYASRLAQRPG